MKKQHSVNIRLGTDDVATFVNVFLRNEYGLPDRMDAKTVVDIGANVGFFAVACLERGAEYVHCYEPVADNCDAIRRNVASYGRRCRVFDLAVSPYPVELVEPPDSARHNSGWSCEPSDELSEIPSISLPQVTSRFKNIDLLKIDIEGGEWPIFRKTPKSAWDNVREVVAELHHGGTVGEAKTILMMAGFGVFEYTNAAPSPSIGLIRGVRSAK